MTMKKKMTQREKDLQKKNKKGFAGQRDSSTRQAKAEPEKVC